MNYRITKQNTGLIKRIRNIFISIIYVAYLHCRKLIRIKNTSTVYCTVLLYHSISDDEVFRFKEQMTILKQLTIPIPLDYNGPFKKDACYSMVTFDDAFKSVIDNALPEMRKLEIPFTLFIPAGQLGTNPGWFENAGEKDTSETISSADELLSIPSDIVTFGSHTIDHYNLRQLNYEKACVEIKESKKILESQLHKEIQYFAFPYGAYNSVLIACCLETGYKQIFSTIPEPPFQPLRNYLKGRIEIYLSDSKIEFMLKILGGYGWKARSKLIKDIFKA